MTNNDKVRELVAVLRGESKAPPWFAHEQAADLIEKLSALPEILRSCKSGDVGVWHTADQHELILVNPASVAETIERTFKEVLGDE